MKRSPWQFIVLTAVAAGFADMAYEGMRGIAGAYLGLLGASAATVGIVAGTGELAGNGLRLLSGWLGDRTRGYWTLTFIGYAINLVAIPGLALAGRWEVAAGLVVLERIGKGLRSPARSTLVSHAALEVGAGKSFGWDEAIDQAGAITGPLLVGLAMWLHGGADVDRQRTAFLVLAAPVVVNLVVLSIARSRYPRPEELSTKAPAPADPHVGRRFWIYMAAAGLMGAGLADWALIAFHLEARGLVGPELLAVVYAGAMAVDAVAALIFGHLFDRRGLAVLIGSAALCAGAAPLLFLPAQLGVVLAGAALWGIGMGAQESVFKAAIATLVPAERRGRAYGLFYAMFGVAWWAGSTVMGLLYDRSLLALALFASGAQLAAIPLLATLARRR
ncbi:MAG TPA: MFS transporter [Kofleriaceae bacterium]|jgi:MFS family permease|nr:MFS transporter [Kofleriaceae bacterium]